MVDRIRNNGVKLQQLRVSLNIRKNFLMIRIVKSAVIDVMGVGYRRTLDKYYQD